MTHVCPDCAMKRGHIDLNNIACKECGNNDGSNDCALNLCTCIEVVGESNNDIFFDHSNNDSELDSDEELNSDKDSIVVSFKRRD